MMKNSLIYLNYEGSDYGVHHFDPQVDFSQFLEEARKQASEVNFQASSTYSEETGKGELGQKSWKKSLFSWLKVEKRSKPRMEPANSSYISKPKKGHVSGPIYDSSGGDDTRQRLQHPCLLPIF